MTLVQARRAKGGRGGDDAPAAPRVACADDTYSWALQQAELLHAGRFDLIDDENIADEIAALAKTESRALRSAIRLIIHHLLKWDFQAERRTRSWAVSVRTHRRGVDPLLRESPGLRSQLPMVSAEAFADARDSALDESGLGENAIPLACPYSWDDIMTCPIEWPEQP